MHYLINDIEFEKILKFLQKISGIHKRNIKRLRKFIEAIFYLCKSGCAWRLLPPYYGNWRSIHKRFMDWSKRMIWEKLFEQSKIDPDLEWVMIDSTIVRANACASGYEKDSQNKEALGRSRGGFTTKIHTLVDALGNPLKFLLTPGQHSDFTQAESLTKEIFNAYVLADKGYDSDQFIEYLQEKGCTPVIPPKSNRKKQRLYDKDLYKERHLIECFFSKLKQFRRVFSRFEKSARSYLSLVQLVGVLLWIR